MSVDAPDDASTPARPRLDGERPDDRTTLASLVVRYGDTADRRTLYPTEVTEEKRLTRWLSAADDAFVRLDTRR